MSKKERGKNPEKGAKSKIDWKYEVFHYIGPGGGDGGGSRVGNYVKENVVPLK